MIPDVVGLVQPIVDRVPAPIQSGLSAVVDGSLPADIQSLVRSIDTAISGDAGAAMVAKFGSGVEVARLVDSVGRKLDELGQQGEQACVAAGRDLLVIAQEAMAEAASSINPLQLVGPFAPLVIAEVQAIAVKHLGRAEARLRELGQQLLQLATDAEAAEVPAAAIPVAPEVSAAVSEPVPAAPAEPVVPADPVLPAEQVDDSVAAPTEAAAAAVAAAKTQLGTPYVWGGTTPGEGFDCSGFTQWAYQQAGVELPRLADQQAVGPQIPMDQVQPGDLAVWDGHVAMVIEDGQMIEAGDPVSINPIRTENIGMGFHGFYRPTA